MPLRPVRKKAWLTAKVPVASMSCSHFNDRDAALELSFIESEAQTHRLGEAGGESVEVDQGVGRSHFGEGDGPGAVVHGNCDSIADHLVREPCLPTVVPGRQLFVVLLRQAP